VPCYLSESLYPQQLALSVLRGRKRGDATCEGSRSVANLGTVESMQTKLKVRSNRPYGAWFTDRFQNCDQSDFNTAQDGCKKMCRCGVGNLENTGTRPSHLAWKGSLTQGSVPGSPTLAHDSGLWDKGPALKVG
jgi:hypothetical protein